MTTKNLITQYYQAFNQHDMDTFMSLLTDDVRHDVNQGHQEVGKDKFIHFMERMNQSYQEQVKQLTIFVSDDDKKAAAEFIITGKYIQTDKGLPEATGQTYELPCGAFFEIKNNKISRVTMYYNLQDWLKQVQK